MKNTKCRENGARVGVAGRLAGSRSLDICVPVGLGRKPEFPGRTDRLPSRAKGFPTADGPGRSAWRDEAAKGLREVALALTSKPLRLMWGRLSTSRGRGVGESLSIIKGEEPGEHPLSTALSWTWGSTEGVLLP